MGSQQAEPALPLPAPFTMRSHFLRTKEFPYVTASSNAATFDWQSAVLIMESIVQQVLMTICGVNVAHLGSD